MKKIDLTIETMEKLGQICPQLKDLPEFKEIIYHFQTSCFHDEQTRWDTLEFAFKEKASKIMGFRF